MKAGVAMGIISLMWSALVGCGQSVTPTDATAPNKSDTYWQLNNNFSLNGTPYHKVEVSPGKWQWQVDQESLQAMRDEESRRAQLFRDLSERKLSHKDLMRVYVGMNTYNMQVYFAVDKYAELYDALVKQWEIQTGRQMEGYRPQSTAKGEFGRSPQEEDNKRQVEALIAKLRDMTK
jgi:hypothetical protein